MPNQDVKQKRSSSRPDETEQAAAEPAKHAKGEPGVTTQQTDELLKDIDDILGEIEDAEQWVKAYVQKPGQ